MHTKRVSLLTLNTFEILRGLGGKSLTREKAEQIIKPC